MLPLQVFFGLESTAFWQRGIVAGLHGCFGGNWCFHSRGWRHSVRVYAAEWQVLLFIYVINTSFGFLRRSPAKCRCQSTCCQNSQQCDVFK